MKPSSSFKADPSTKCMGLGRGVRRCTTTTATAAMEAVRPFESRSCSQDQQGAVARKLESDFGTTSKAQKNDKKQFCVQGDTFNPQCDDSAYLDPLYECKEFVHELVRIIKAQNKKVFFEDIVDKFALNTGNNLEEVAVALGFGNVKEFFTSVRIDVPSRPRKPGAGSRASSVASSNERYLQTAAAPTATDEYALLDLPHKQSVRVLFRNSRMWVKIEDIANIFDFAVTFIEGICKFKNVAIKDGAISREGVILLENRFETHLSQEQKEVLASLKKMMDVD